MYDPSHDPWQHNPFDNSDLHHDAFNDSSQHHNQLIGDHQGGGAFAQQAPTNFDPQHAGLEDILQLFNLGPINHLIDAIHSQHIGDITHNDFPVELGPLSHVIDILQTPPAHHDPPHPGASGAAHGSAGEALPHFHPDVPFQTVIGDPAMDMSSWHQQVHYDTCAIASQGFIIESLTGQHISEDALMYEAQQYGWYRQGAGTPLYHVGDLLEAHGISVVRKEGASLADIADQLRQQHKIIVGVNGEDYWYHGSPNDPLASFPGIPGQQADHAIEVIGINNTQPDHPLVIINDPGVPNGQGLEIPADIFYQAWSTSDYYMVATAGNNSPPAGYWPAGQYGNFSY